MSEQYSEAINKYIKNAIDHDRRLDGLRNDISVNTFYNPMHMAYTIRVCSIKDPNNHFDYLNYDVIHDKTGNELDWIIKKAIRSYLEYHRNGEKIKTVDLGKIISQEDFDSLKHMDDAIDAARYMFMSKWANTINNKEENEMKETRTESEVKFAQALDEINQKKEKAIAKAKADAERAAAEEKKKLDIAELKEKNAMMATDCWSFFEELRAAGFNEDQAMQILLTKMKGA